MRIAEARIGGSAKAGHWTEEFTCFSFHLCTQPDEMSLDVESFLNGDKEDNKGLWDLVSDVFGSSVSEALPSKCRASSPHLNHTPCKYTKSPTSTPHCAGHRAAIPSLP